MLPAVVFGVLAGGVVTTPVSEAEPIPALAAALHSGDCARCHQVPGTEPLGRIDSCHSCHVWVKDVAGDPVRRDKAKAVFPLWERYEKNVATYLEVPSLEAAMARLDPEWVRKYLKDPHDLRPGLNETMPRFGLSDTQIDAIVDGFAAAKVAVPTVAPPDPSRVAEGEKLFSTKGCVGCHTFGARSTGAIKMAPDLAHARARMSPDTAAAWIKNPKAISPAATMPSLGLTDAEALALRDYVWLADPKWTQAKPLGKAPTPVKAPVTYAQVEERVFGKICVHCHMNPDLNQGRSGPGNGGGFGYPATGIELQTYEGVVAVADRIPDALLRRRLEAHRDAIQPGEQPAPLTRPATPGMPLGLPPISDEDIALVLGWIEQGTQIGRAHV